MRYLVNWAPVAERELAAAWLASRDRRAVTEAAHVIDQQPSASPRTVGESRYGQTRIVIVEPLAALFEVIEDDRQVRVLSVWRCRDD